MWSCLLSAFCTNESNSMFCPHTHANAYKPSSTVLCECNLMLLIWWAIPWMSRHTEKGVDSTMPTASTIKGLDNCFSALLRTSVIIFYADAQSFIVISWTFIPFQSPIVLAREGSFTFIHLFFSFDFCVVFSIFPMVKSVFYENCPAPLAVAATTTAVIQFCLVLLF